MCAGKWWGRGARAAYIMYSGKTGGAVAHAGRSDISDAPSSPPPLTITERYEGYPVPPTGAVLEICPGVCSC